ncbi:uncharacterized protein LOC144688944 isoform X3 [Cetorhinus maximus]
METLCMWMSPGPSMEGYGLLLPPGAPPQPPHFNPYVVPQPPPGGFAPPQGFGAPPQYGYGQDMSGFGQAPGFSDPNQPAPSYGGPSAPAPPGAPPSAPGGFARGQNHNAQGFHPYRR